MSYTRRALITLTSMAGFSGWLLGRRQASASSNAKELTNVRGYKPNTVASLYAYAGTEDGQQVSCTGYHSAGDGGGGIFFWDSSSDKRDNSGTVIKPRDYAENGRWVRIESGALSVKWFGARGDGVTDDTSAIQRAIDCAIYLGPNPDKVYFPGGRYLISDSIHLGYGEMFHTCTLEGPAYGNQGNSALGEPHQAGASIDASQFSDRPAIVVQGARGTAIRHIAILGANENHIDRYDLGGKNPSVDDLEGSNWVDPSLHPNADSRYAPYAAIAIDPYSGVRPATAYPNVSYPAFTGITDQYNKRLSSNVVFENLQINGFVVGFVVQPSDVNGNADFISFTRCQIKKCKYGISIGGSQARSTRIEHGFCSNIFKVFVNGIHGSQAGRFTCTIIDFSVGSSIQIFDIPDSRRAAPLVVQSLYCESTYRIGDIGSHSANVAHPVHFIGCDFSFGSQLRAGRGKPRFDVECNYNQTVIFEGGKIGNYGSVFVVGGGGRNIQFRDVNIEDQRVRRSLDYEKLAHNCLAGGIVLTGGRAGAAGGVGIGHLGFVGGGDWTVRYAPYDLDTGSTEARLLRGPVHVSNRGVSLPWFAKWAMHENGGSPVAVPRLYSSKERSSFASYSVSGSTATITGDSRSDWEVMTGGGQPGDVIIDTVMGLVFFVRSREGNTIFAELQNSLRVNDAGDLELDQNVGESKGHLLFINSRIYMPSTPIRGDVDSASPVIRNAANGAGAEFNGEDVANGDWILTHAEEEEIFDKDESAVVSAEPGVIVMAGNGKRPLEYKLLPFWIRRPPPNV